MSKFISNYHTHTDYCDGKNTMEDMVLSAIKKGLKHYGISSHATILDQPSWTIAEGKIEDYLNDIVYLKNKYKDKINIYKGLEIDFFKGLGLNPMALVYIEELDYYIGSVHGLYSKDFNTVFYIDDTPEAYDKSIEILFSGDIRQAVKEYYDCVVEMTLKHKPTIIGHIDLIRKNNSKSKYRFDESEQWYKDIVKNVIKALKGSESIIEVNTGGIARFGKELLYPSQYILEQIYINGMDVTVNGDSHTVDSVDFYYDEVYELLKDIGFNKTLVFTDDGWKPYYL